MVLAVAAAVGARAMGAVTAPAAWAEVEEEVRARGAMGSAMVVLMVAKAERSADATAVELRATPWVATTATVIRGAVIASD